MFTLLAQMPVAPKSLFISGVSAPDLNHDCVDMGGFGYVFKGKYKGKYVALKMLYKGVRGNVSKCIASTCATGANLSKLY